MTRSRCNSSDPPYDSNGRRYLESLQRNQPFECLVGCYRGPDRPSRGGMTPDWRIGSHIFGMILLVITTSCGSRTEAQPASQKLPTPSAPASDPATPHVNGESCLGVNDKGVFADLDDKVQLALPKGLTAARVSGLLDR